MHTAPRSQAACAPPPEALSVRKAADFSEQGKLLNLWTRQAQRSPPPTRPRVRKPKPMSAAPPGQAFSPIPECARPARWRESSAQARESRDRAARLARTKTRTEMMPRSTSAAQRREPWKGQANLSSREPDGPTDRRRRQCRYARPESVSRRAAGTMAPQAFRARPGQPRRVAPVRRSRDEPRALSLGALSPREPARPRPDCPRRCSQ